MANMIQLQIGKNGLTQGFIEDLRKRFEVAESIRISLLKSSGRDKEKKKEWADKIIKELGPKFTSNVIGFTIVIRKWRKERA